MIFNYTSDLNQLDINQIFLANQKHEEYWAEIKQHLLSKLYFSEFKVM